MHNYHEAHDAFPIGALHSTTPGLVYTEDRGASFFLALLPYMEENNLYKGLDMGAAGGAGNMENTANPNGVASSARGKPKLQRRRNPGSLAISEGRAAVGAQMGEPKRPGAALADRE